MSGKDEQTITKKLSSQYCLRRTQKAISQLDNETEDSIFQISMMKNKRNNGNQHCKTKLLSKIRRQQRERKKILEKHRLSERRIRHHDINETLKKVYERIPGFCTYPRKPKVHKLKHIIRYVTFLEKEIEKLARDLNITITFTFKFMPSSLKEFAEYQIPDIPKESSVSTDPSMALIIQEGINNFQDSEMVGIKEINIKKEKYNDHDKIGTFRNKKVTLKNTFDNLISGDGDAKESKFLSPDIIEDYCKSRQANQYLSENCIFNNEASHASSCTEADCGGADDITDDKLLSIPSTSKENFQSLIDNYKQKRLVQTSIIKYGRKSDKRKITWLNGFMMFACEHRNQFIKDNKGLPTAQISKLLGINWKQLPEDKKQFYKKKAEIMRSKKIIYSKTKLN